MKTIKQQELIDSFLDTLDNELGMLYRELAMHLSSLGYNPKKQRSYIVFKHSLHNREMAKMGVTHTKDHTPYFALRFSACKNYSQKITDVVRAYLINNPNKLFPHCEDGKCIFRADGDRTPFYEYTFPDGQTGSFCGAKALVIPDITEENLKEIKSLISEEHEYIIKHKL